jgi:hypothetical protein
MNKIAYIIANLKFIFIIFCLNIYGLFFRTRSSFLQIENRPKNLLIKLFIIVSLLFAVSIAILLLRFGWPYLLIIAVMFVLLPFQFMVSKINGNLLQKINL